jgi:hypothetical protein
MKSLKSMCREMDDLFVRRQKDPDLWPDFEASFSESETCGCRYCYLACQSMTEFRCIKENRIWNENATVINAGLTFGSRDDTVDNEADIVKPTFRGSGLAFSANGGMKEVFVIDRMSDENGL